VIFWCCGKALISLHSILVSDEDVDTRRCCREGGLQPSDAVGRTAYQGFII
jgi:hypothetical protein